MKRTSLLAYWVALAGATALRKLILVALVLCVTVLLGQSHARTNQLVVRGTTHIAASRGDAALALYNAAKQCWSQKGGRFRPDVVVDSVMTLDSVVIGARFSSLGSGVMNPFLRFVVTDDAGRAEIVMETQEIKWRDQERYLRDAAKWMAGIPVCSTPASS